MDLPRPSHESSEATLLLDITVIARARARTYLNSADADDVAQDVVLDCLMRLRDGTLRRTRRELDAFVKELAESRAIDQLRRRRRRREREEAFAAAYADRPRSWMLPERHATEQDYVAVHEALLGKLSHRRRLVYMMVREQKLSYKETAQRLGITTTTVHFHVVRAQRELRNELEALGYIEPQNGDQNARGASVQRRSGEQRRRSSTNQPRTLLDGTSSCTDRSASCTDNSLTCTDHSANRTGKYATRTSTTPMRRVAEAPAVDAIEEPLLARQAGR